MGDRIHIATDADGIAVLAMRDAAAQNAFHHAFVDDLFEAIQGVSADASAKVCIVRGLPDVFCAGAHRELLLELADGRVSPSDILLPRALLDMPIPTIAAMEGHAIGGGLALGLCCDVLVMARESRYGCSFMNMGFTPGMGTTGLLQDAVGTYLAHEMLFGGQAFKGSHFEGRGGINYILPKDAVFGKAMQVAQRFSEKPRFALELLKRTLSAPRRQAFEAARTIEAQMHAVCFAQPGTRDRIRENY